MVGEGKARTTVREALQSLAEQGDPEALSELANLPTLPPLGAHLWQWFAELTATRTASGLGPNRLTRAEIRAWETDEGQCLDLWERRAILRIDQAWISSAHAAPK
jgi:hypothetical protein